MSAQINHDSDIVRALLTENGITCNIENDAIYLYIPYISTKFDGLMTRSRWIFGAHRSVITCDRPGINDPDFIEKVKEFVKFCGRIESCEFCAMKKSS